MATVPMPERDDRGGRDSPNLKAALYHARAGRPVFPCSNRDKTPLIPKREGGRGFKDATTDEAQIRAWWSRYPDAVPGMPTGARVGVWVLDVDTKAGKQGMDSLARLEQEHGPLPDTVTTITATGGLHYFFRHPRDGREIATNAGAIGLHLDVRGDGGYVILPRSLMADGRRYEWEGSSDPDEGAAVAHAPPWLLNLVTKDQGPRATGGDEPQAAAEPVVEGQRNWWLFRLGCSLRAKGLGEAAIIGALRAENAERCQPPLDDREVVTTAKSAAAKPAGLSPEYERRRREGHETTANAPPGDQSPPPFLRVVAGTAHDPRPVIEIRAGEMPEVVDGAEAHLLRERHDIFQHGTRLVRVGSWDSPQGLVDRPTGAGVLLDITPGWLADAMGRVIRWKRWDARAKEMRPTDCPMRVANTLLERSGAWRFPVLIGFCDAPTLDLRGRVVSAPGYDAQSGLYLERPVRIDPIGELVREDAERAAEILHEALSTFPFLSPSDASAALALVITALLRRILPSAPIGAISASTPGSGKSLLVDVISAIATGRTAAVTGIGAAPEELEKRVDALLLKGDAVASFDNVDRPIKSDVLCQATTQAAKSIRVMGLSKIVEAPTNVALFMTGNNLTLVGDLVRRCVLVNLEAGCERPELREFERDAVAYVLAHRAVLVRAALVISKAYLDAGCPRVEAAPFGSFERWDRMVRRALLWAGYPDPIAPAERMRDQDHELAGARDLLRAWQLAAQGPLTAAELCELIRERIPSSYGDAPHRYPELTEAAIQVMGDLGKWGPRELGYRLRSLTGRLLGGRRIAKAADGRHGVRWLVESVGGGVTM